MATQRLRRKDLKRPDEFLTLTGQILAWVRTHGRLTLWGGIAVAAVIGAVALTLGFRAARQRDANADLAQAMAAMRANNLSQAATEFGEIRERWNATEPGTLAALLAASTNLRLGNTDAALTAIQQCASAPGLSEYLRQQIAFVWGVALEQKGDSAGAAERYRSAAELSGPYAGPAILGEARVAEQTGKADEARALYRQYYDKFPDAPDREAIKAKAGVTDAGPPASAG